MRSTISLLVLLVAAATLRAQQIGAVPHTISPDLSVRQIAPGVWLHTWWMERGEWGRFSSNGLIVVSDGEALLIDTPVNDTMTAQLLRWVAEELKAPVRRAIVTHAHDDRMGGIGELKRRGIISYALPGTVRWAAAQGWLRPDSMLDKQQHVRVGRRSVMTWFAGAGHTPDNIVVWLEKERILFGGCLVKSENSGSIGNLGDAVVKQWPATIKRLRRRFAKARIVIPGHGEIGGLGALRQTLRLLEGVEGR